MKGIPGDLDLSPLLHAEVEQVCLGVWQIQIRFDNGANISIEGDWDGTVIDRSSDTVRESPYHLHLLLQRVFVRSEVSPPLQLRLHFTGGLVLTLTVGNQGFESFSIEPLGIIV
jgi:hypothetical protein